MEASQNITSIVLERRDFRENDVLVSFYSKEKGRVDLIARGAKKIKSKLAGHIEPLNLVDLMLVHGRKYDYVGSVKNINSFLNIKKDLSKTLMALKVLKIFKDNIKENDTDQDIFIHLFESFIFLDSSNKIDLEFFYNIFIYKLLGIMGFGTDLGFCLGCKKKIIPNNNFIDISEGGLFCSSCGDKKQYLTISDNSIKMLKLAINNSWEDIFKIKIDKKIKSELESIISSLKEYSLS